MTQTELNQIPILVLAYVGDALYELHVREYIAKNFKATRPDLMHKEGVVYVCANGQAGAIQEMMESNFLTQAEIDFARRAHNHKIATKPKNADPVTYKWATAFEALLGYTKAGGNLERLDELMTKAVELTEERRKNNAKKG